MANKEFDNVQLFAEYDSTVGSNVVNVFGNKSKENIAYSLSKIKNWFPWLVPTNGSAGQILEWYNNVPTWRANANADTVKQTHSTDTDFHPLVLGAPHSASAWSGDDPIRETTDQVYMNKGIYVKPSTNTIYATAFVGKVTHPTIPGTGADTTSSVTPLHGQGFTTVDVVTRDSNGHVTGINTKTVTLPAQYVHPTYTRTDTTSTASPAHGGTFTAIDSVSSTNGHVTAVNLKTVTLPAQYVHPSKTQTDTTSSVSPAHEGSFTVIDSITRDTQGHVSGINVKTVTLPSDKDTNWYHKTGTWNGLTYTAAKVGSPEDLAFTIPTGTTATTVAVGNHTHAYTVPVGGITIKTGSSDQSHITLQTLMTWLTTTKGYITPNTARSLTLYTSWNYAGNDILQLTIDGTAYELQLAGVIIEFDGTITDYQTGTFRLRIHSSPTLSFTPASGYTQFPASHIAEYTCNGSGYYPTWKMLVDSGDKASTSAYGITKLYDGVNSTSTSLAATANAVKTAYDKGNHSHPYLPLAGGTMTGDITFTGLGNTPSSYPAKSKGIYWSGGTDSIDMYYNVRSADAGELIINMRDDTNVRTSFAYNGTVVSYIDTSGVYNGAATKLGTENKGSPTKGIYLSGGAPQEMTYSLGSTVNGGTANCIAYYSGANAISSAAKVTYVNANNSASTPATVAGLHIESPTYGNTAANMLGGVAGVFSYGDGGPQIRFKDGSSSQAGALIFTADDTAASGTSWHFVSNETDWNVISKRFHAKTSISIGTDKPSTSYNLTVNGTSYFANTIYIKGTSSGNASINYVSYGNTRNYASIKFYDGDVNGHGIQIGGGGLTVVGGGEAAQTVFNSLSTLGLDAASEAAVIASDGPIYFYTNVDTGIANRKAVSINTSGYLNTGYINMATSDEDNSFASSSAIIYSNSDKYLRRTTFSKLASLLQSETTVYDGHVIHQNDYNSAGFTRPVHRFIRDLRPNKLAFTLPENITMEYSTNAGSSWTSFGYTDAQKAGPFISRHTGGYIAIGPTSGERTTSMRTRITITNDGRDCFIDQFYIWMSTSGHGTTVDIQYTTQSAKTTWVDWRMGVGLGGWAGPNVINVSELRYGNAIYSIRFTFKITSIHADYKTQPGTIYDIQAYGGMGCWGSKNNMMTHDSLFTWDYGQNATFPANVSATKFIGPLQGNADTATTAEKLGTSTVGSGSRPIYLYAGTPKQCDTPTSGAWWNGVPGVASNGVMEVGKYIDFHGTNTTTADYDYRIQAGSAWLDLVSPTTQNKVTVISPDYSVIQFQTTKTSYTITQPVIYAYPLTTSGLSVLFQSGGNTVIGGGESASTLYTNDYDSMTTAENESLYLASDSSEIHLITNAQSYGTRKVLKVADGQLVKTGGQWIWARDTAPVYVNKPNTQDGGYYPAWFAKTKSGGWSMGVLSHADNLYITYTTDEDYSNGNNNNEYTIQFQNKSGTVALTSDIPTADDHKVTQNNLTSGGTFPVILGGNTSAASVTDYVNKRYDALRLAVAIGTTSTDGYGELIIGNSTASGTAGNTYGQISIYSSNTAGAVLRASSTTSWRSFYFPGDKGGTVAVTTDLAAYLPLAGGTMNTNTSITIPYGTGNIIYDGGTGLSVHAPTNSGWARGIDYYVGSTWYGGFGANGSGGSFDSLYIGKYNDKTVQIDPINKITTFDGKVTMSQDAYVGGNLYARLSQRTNKDRQSTANLACTGTGAMQLILATSTMDPTTERPNTGKPASDGFILDFDWDNTGQYKAQIFVPNSGTSVMQWRGQHGSTDWSAANAQWKTLLDTSNYSSYALPLSGGTMSGTITHPANTVAINLRADNTSTWQNTIMTQSNGDEAVVFANANARTSWMFVNGEDSIAHPENNRWQSLTPALQIKGGCVAIGKLIPSGTTPTTRLDIAGSTALTGDVMLKTTGSASDDSGDIIWYYGNGKEKMRIWTDNTYTAAKGPNYRVYKSDGTLLYSGNLPLADGTSAGGTWAINISGTATKATQDGDGNNISSSYMRYRGSTTTASDNTLWSQIGIKEYQGVYPDGSPLKKYSWGAVASIASLNARLDLYYTHHSSDASGTYISDGLQFRTGWSTEKRDWRMILDNVNCTQYVVPLRQSQGNYNSIASAYFGDKNTYIRITLPTDTQSIWALLNMKIFVRSSYSTDSGGTIEINCHHNNSSTTMYDAGNAFYYGNLGSINVYAAEGNKIYILGIGTYTNISIERLLVGDTSRTIDFTNKVTIDSVASLPSGYQTFTMRNASSTVHGITVQTDSSTKVKKISLETLMTWLTNTKNYIPYNKWCSVTLFTSWAYADNDVLQFEVDGAKYEMQLAGVVIEFSGLTTAYNAGMFRLRIHNCPANGGWTVDSTNSYYKFPEYGIVEYTCNGSSYAPAWKMIMNNTSGYFGPTTGPGDAGAAMRAWQLHRQSVGPKLTFGHYSGAQTAHLYFTDWDVWRGSASLTLCGSQGGETFGAPKIMVFNGTKTGSSGDTYTTYDECSLLFNDRRGIGAFIKYEDTTNNSERNVLAMYQGDQFGVGVVLGCGGLTIVGGGEAASGLKAAVCKEGGRSNPWDSNAWTPASEAMVVGSDGDIFFAARANDIDNCQSDWGSVTKTVSGQQVTYYGPRTMKWNTSGYLVPSVAHNGSIGSGAAPWSSMYSDVIYANTASSSTSGGISLYGTSSPDTYGIIFRGTSQKGKHGYVQSDWATYFTMNDSGTRGWVFNSQKNVASISGAGNAVFNGSVTVGGNTANTSGCRMTYNSSTQSLDFVFA